ncbi:Taxadien-5-alpha-ol O-acetyltransferase, partial [Sesamum angolense]
TAITISTRLLGQVHAQALLIHPTNAEILEAKGDDQVLNVRSNPSPHLEGKNKGRSCHDRDQDQDSTVLFAVDIRDMISPPLPSSFMGNAVITGYARAKAKDLVDGPLSYGVEMVREGTERVTSEYIRSVIDWLEVYKGTPATCGCAFYVSAWWKLGFGEVDLGFGRAKHAGPILSGNDEFVLLLDGGDCDEGGKGLGINVWIGLEKEKMERFLKCVFDM